MAFNLDKYKNSLTKLDASSGILGLDKYLKSLEFYYFSKVTLRNCSSDELKVDMALDMTIPISLLEMLAHFNKGRWGNNGKETSPLEQSFTLLARLNDRHLDIEELTLFLDDTTIVIKRIYNRSLPEQLNEIITQIASHYVFFSKGLTEKPYEIFVPVIEDNPYNVTKECQANDKSIKTPVDYFGFWGVYLESQEDALIYDLQKNTFIPADLDLYMLED